MMNNTPATLSLQASRIFAKLQAISNMIGDDSAEKEEYANKKKGGRGRVFRENKNGKIKAKIRARRARDSKRGK